MGANTQPGKAASRLRENSDFVLGIILIVLALTFLVLVAKLPFGSAARLGPGYFPRIVSALLLACGCAIALRGFLAGGDRIGAVSVSSSLVVLVAICTFAVTLERAGLLVASTLLMVITAAAVRPRLSLLKIAILSIAATAAAWLIFVFALRLPLPVLPTWT